MWKMFEPDFMECGEDVCDGPGPPPQFHIPPPPRPPFVPELVSGVECTEDSVPEIDICAAIPVSFIQFLYNFFSTAQEICNFYLLFCSHWNFEI